MNNSVFVDASGALPEREPAWEPVVIAKDVIDGEIDPDEEG